ncbi:MAG: hypothetical protein AAB358_02520 [Patescibacteria group bacterium]
MMARLSLLAVLMLTVSGIAKAESMLKINKSGEVVSAEVPEEWRPLTEAEIEAVNNPGQEVPICLPAVLERVDFWHVAPLQKYEKTVVFKDGRIQAITKAGAIEGKPKIASYVVFCLIAVGLMLWSNLLAMTRGNSMALAVFAVVFAAFAALVAAAAVVAFAAAAAVAAFAAAATNDTPKAYLVLSLVFYALIGMAVFI